MKKRILSCFMALALCLTLLPATAQAADDSHDLHCICGKTHTAIGDHSDDDQNAFANAKWLTSALDVHANSQVLRVDSENGSIDGEPADTDGPAGDWLLPEGAYYLKGEGSGKEVTIDKPIVIRKKVTICLNGKTLQSTAKNKPVFLIEGTGELTLTNCEGTGKVIHNRSLSGSGTGVEVNGGTFNLYGGTITGNTTDTYGGGVCVSGGTFNMYGGTISGNNATKGGGGVYVSGGTFNLYDGGTISGNTVTSDDTTGGGGGVYVSGGKFEMSGGTISGNTADLTDGGVGVYNNATFNMSGGTISGNKATNNKPSYTTYGGGVGVYQTATFNMSGTASITNNTANQGGGVHVKGNFTMDNNASVTGNTATNNGGGVYVNSGTFNMNDGTITGNTASGDKADQGNGGGVYVKSGTFEMNGSASVTGNTATNTKKEDTTYGGGVGVYGGTFTMNGNASIKSNKATNGGGVCVKSGGTFTMNGKASVTNNTGNGVFVDGGTFTVSGTPTVKENTIIKNGAASNVHLAVNTYITIGKIDPTDNASIGVTKTVDDGVFAQNVSTDCSGNFFSDDTPRHKVEYNKTTQQLVLTKSSAPEHTHIWTYKANEATITATCTGKGNCDVNKNGGSVTINPPANLTQGSNGKTATVTVSDNWKGPAVNESTITYWKFVGGNIYESLDNVAPTEVGQYKASITVKDATASKDVTASVVYNIVASTTGKKEQKPLILKSTEQTLAVGKTLTLSVGGGSTNGAVNYCITSGADNAELKDNVLTAKKVGTVTVTATMAGNDTYNAVTSGPLTITITEKTGGTTPSQPGGSSSGGSGSYDSNPIIKTETKNNPDGSTTKSETRKDGTVTQTTTAKDGSTGTVKTDKNGKTEMNAKLSDKAVEDAKKSGEPVKAPVEVEASRNSGTAPTVKVELPKNAGKTEVEIPVSNAKPGTVAVLVHADGTEEILKASVPTENGIRLTMDGSATVKIIDNSKDFVDTRNHWAREEIDFVSARELVNGMSATRYAPDATATRAQLWTILARQSDANLSGGANWYEKAQLWSKDKGISDGTNPGATISRAQMVTMLWRTMGQPTAGGTANFTDVPADSYYASAVAWAVENGITDGVGDGRFDPAATCTRAQIATFLRRAVAE